MRDRIRGKAVKGQAAVPYSHSRTDLSGKSLTHISAPDEVIDLNTWHHAIHQVAGDMAIRFNRATAADLERWVRMLQAVAQEMETERQLLRS
jgi:hypothetical protein